MVRRAEALVKRKRLDEKAEKGLFSRINMEKIKIGISRCLLGDKVRYDGGHKEDHYLTGTLGPYVDWFPVCPEVECGLPVPREAMRLVDDPAGPRLKTIHTGVDHTDRMTQWSRTKLEEIAGQGLCGFIFKSRSPSSGMAGVPIYGPAGAPEGKGAGVFASAFMGRFPLIPVEDEERLQDPLLRDNFLARVFVFKGWQELLAKESSTAALIGFHSRHKLLVLSHSTKHYTMLGRLLASPKDNTPGIHSQYIALLMDALRLTSTPKKNTNALSHMAGYFKKYLSGDEKQELAGLIEEYRKGFVPLDVPRALIGHYARKYGEPYLEAQVYLFPHPTEIMLRNHT
jgi:uncharacterized protein YbgA (DUF1722 family)/uncharacterized protein YbbK (DUF523 family)